MMTTPTVHKWEDGWRYIRSYRAGGQRRWALWERQDGRMRRVGTALAEDTYRDFLFERGAYAR